MDDFDSPPRRVSTGALLGGRVRYQQYSDGYRTGIEPVLLAAAVRARGTDSIVEAGTGAGAALLCLAWRIPGANLVGVERDGPLAQLAAANATANGWQDRLHFHHGPIETFVPPTGPRGRFDHAIANPPWHDPAGTASPDPGRASAKQATPDLLRDWITALAGCLRHRGTLGLIVPPAMLPAAIDALAARRCGSVELMPLWPKPDRPARMVILRAISGGRAPMRLLAGLVLHTPSGGYTEGANRVLIGGEPLG